MLPPGSAHVRDAELVEQCGVPPNLPFRIPSLKKIARGLDIDFAEAVVGFDYHGGKYVLTSISN
jgi:hypothetical protein